MTSTSRQDDIGHLLTLTLLSALRPPRVLIVENLNRINETTDISMNLQSEHLGESFNSRSSKKETENQVLTAGNKQVLNEKVNIKAFQKYFWGRRLEKQVKLFLKNIVVQHIQIIEDVKLTEETFRWCILFYTQIGTVIAAFGISQLFQSTNSPNSETFRIGFILFNGLGCIKLLNYFGQVLQNESETLRQALYNCDWTDKPHSLKKGLIIMQTVANRPLKLTIGGIYSLNMETFASIMSAVYSYSGLTHTLINSYQDI
ncbi:uncharacterized protein LOC129002349 [Macrosteles quadrilineatus]|uniref:uncharacterized protein LOC129002349 n=1 Tax=Macrosteles quadrilineatus TaxID=74068 RepID=UPI0023E16595|nr:uncharacterized protein LOC129002349 [Macrosteles quadrilineatus]